MPRVPTPLLRPTLHTAAFEPLRERVRPFVEDAAVRERRRKEALAELLDEYEAEHGVITEDELIRLDSEWLT